MGLQIRVSGATGLHLSVVDLPGIIQNEEQSEADVEAVHALVDSYMSSPRSLILAVVQAWNDIRKCKRFDSSGERTIGVVTKPDLINDGTEWRIAQLARNEDTTRLKLGFFILKNPSPKEMEKILSPKDRDALERGYFASAPWNQQDLDQERLLRQFLQELLDRHIEKEMPNVRQDLRQLKFDSICNSTLQGNYSDSDFFGASSEDVPSTRLRAVIHRINVEFADTMRLKGEKRIIKYVWEETEGGETGDEIEAQVETHSSVGQLVVSEGGFKKLGEEGDYNHVFLSELFHEQSSRWFQLATRHLSSTYQCLEAFVDAFLSHITDEGHTREKLRERISAALADAELNELWKDEAQQPVTYNHYYTDNIQKARNDSARNALKKAMDDTTSEDYGGRAHISNNGVDIQRLLGLLQNRVIVNMDDQACAEARGALSAYYKVARKTFVDNVCRQVVERHLLRNLPAVFSPDKAASYSDDELCIIASEARDTTEKRERLQTLHTAFKECLVGLLP